MKKQILNITIITLLIFSPLEALSNLDFKDALISACDETKCDSSKCDDPGIVPAGCTLKKACCCEVVDCFLRGMDQGRVVSVDLALKICSNENEKVKAKATETNLDNLKQKVESLNHCLIGSDCGVLTGLSCCTKEHFLINKKADLCSIKEELAELKIIDEEKKKLCKCKATETPKPRYLRCNRDNKCVEKEDYDISLEN